MVPFFILIAAAGVFAAWFGFSSAQASTKKWEDASARLRESEEAARKSADKAQKLADELQAAKTQAREALHEVKAQKKKNWDSRQTVRSVADTLVADASTVSATPAAAVVTAASLVTPEAADVRALEKQLRTAEHALADARSQVAQLEQAKLAAAAQTEDLHKKLAGFEQKSRAEADALRVQLTAEKQRVGAEAKAILDMRRKVEWHRRVHVLDQKEVELAADKMAHLRERFLSLCAENIALLKAVNAPEQAQGQLTAEMARVQADQTKYQAEHAKTQAEDAGTHAPH